jgi:predicted nicotinamide N-methyase
LEAARVDDERRECALKEVEAAMRGFANDGPVVVTTLALAGLSIRLARPAEPDRLLDDDAIQERNRRDDYMPYWAYLWPSAYLLAEEIARTDCFAELKLAGPIEALEIGCGLGLPGLVAVARGLRVQFSDYDTAALEFVARSAAENAFDPCRYSIRPLDWRNPSDERFAIILGADVLYEARLVPLVANLLGKLLVAGGVSLIASPYRASAEAFPGALAEAGLVCQAKAATTRQQDGRLFEGIIYRVTRPMVDSGSMGP